MHAVTLGTPICLAQLSGPTRSNNLLCIQWFLWPKPSVSSVVSVASTSCVLQWIIGEEMSLLHSARTVLRPLGEADVDAIHALWTDPRVRRFLWDDVVIPRERVTEIMAASTVHFAEHRYGWWAVQERGSAELLGFCGLRPSERGAPELLYGLWPHHWGKGLATEAAQAVLSYAFTTLGQAEVVAATDVPNEASVRVLERLGMQLERRGVLNGLDTFFYRLSSNRGTP
jgi:ribosomal-protein-alanine N-acetyltransferase